jgi:hypothetical protein
MKRNLWVKLGLAIIVVMMIASLAACSTSDTDNTVVDEPEVEETTGLFDELVNIIQSVQPLVTTLNGVEETSTVGVDAAIGAEYNLGTDAIGDYSLDIMGNIKATDPEAQISIKDNTLTDDAVNMIYLAYKDGMAYLKEPVTALNTDNTADTTKVDLTAMTSDINIIMDVAMYELAKVYVDIDFTTLGTSIEEVIADASLTEEDLSSYLTISTTETGNKLTVPATSAKLIVSLLNDMAISGKDIEPVVNAIVNTIFSTDAGFSYILNDITFPNIYIEATIVDGTLTGIELGFDYEGVSDTTKDGQYADLYIDLTTFSTATTTTITAPSYVVKTMQVGLDAAMTQKGVSADLDLYVTGNMEDQTSVLVNGTLGLYNNGLTPSIVNAFYNGSSAYIDMLGAYTAVGATTEDSEVYSAEYNMYTHMNDALTEWQTECKSGVVEEEVAGLSMFQSIYDFLGGDMSLLVEVDGVTPDPTQVQMLEALDDKIGNYVRFDIPTTNYGALITTISDEWTVNADTIESIISEETAWADIADGGTWTGNLFLTQDGDDNDLLDIVNLFVCDYVDGEKVDIDSTFLTDYCNRYLALLALTDSDLLIVNENVAAYKAAVEALDDELLYYKNQYKNGTITEDEYNEKVTDHNEALKFAVGIGDNTTLTADYFADLVMKEIFGFSSENALGSNYFNEFIDSGITAKVTCVKGDGLNGGIELWANVNDEAINYITVEGFIKVIDIDVTSGTDFSTVGATVLTEKDTPISGDDHKEIATWDDGTLKLDMANSSETLLNYIYIDEDGEETTEIADAVYVEYYPNADALQDDLWDILEYYKDIELAVEIGE